ncbi:ATP-binding protein [Enterobacter cloacae]|nr:ATP-binding protein [Enterobacter cloacae]ELV2777203.1 ATP-binding protein [Enterobacter cloacae]
MLTIFDIIHGQEGCYILVGKNGSGKSILLYDLAESFHNSGYNVIAVSNTLFDKFLVHPNSAQYEYIGGKLGRYFPALAIKRTISANRSDRVGRIFTVLRKIGYDQRIGVRVKFSRKFKDVFRSQSDRMINHYQAFFDNIGEAIPEALISALNKAVYKTGDGLSVLEWLDGEGNIFYESDFNSYLQLIRFERLLKKAKIISAIEVFLSKDGVTFPLSHASSGELSFIALLVHVAFCVTDNSYIFIDEPENSLHPQWQNEYLELLKEVIGYNQCVIVVATHSPLIVTSLSAQDNAVIFKRTGKGFEKVEAYDDNAEEVYIDYFDTLTPKNRALSNRCVGILDDYTLGKITLDAAKERLSTYGEMSNDYAQTEFLSGVEDILDNINKNKRNHHG